MNKINMPSEVIAKPTDRLEKEVGKKMTEASSKKISLTDKIKALSLSVIGKFKPHDKENEEE